jgi:hypothetical protein
MDNTIFERNIHAFGSRYPDLLPSVLHAGSCADGGYSSRTSRNGYTVPVFHDGTACNSLYDPIRESTTILGDVTSDGCVLFAGIGGGFHIRAFLAAKPDGRCLVCEAGNAEFRSLLEVIDIVDLVEDARITIVPDCADEKWSALVASVWLPAIHGNFRVVTLRPWLQHFSGPFSALDERVRSAISAVSADYSVQAHFGKLWFRNALRNLQSIEGGNGHLPEFDLSKTAIVIAAGPGLESSIADLRANRGRYIIFTTDTAFGPLMAADIVPDVFVSIDAQLVSSRHIMPGLRPETTVIVDLCGNPEIPAKARARGCNVIVAAGGHPLARHAASFSPLPALATNSGTVTVAALDAAHACGFRNVQTVGADFAYVRGKPYARGTYLEEQFCSLSHRLSPSETLYDALMFRAPVRADKTQDGITYRTDVLDRYADAFAAHQGGISWNRFDFKPFPFARFIARYRSSLGTNGTIPSTEDPAFVALLPFLAWYRSAKGEKDEGALVAGAIRLASDLIAGYTELS